jgi:hypothetical protein
LLVAAQSMLRPERGGKFYVGQVCQRIERVDEPTRDRGGMGKQRHTATRERASQFRFGEQTFQASQESGIH